METFFCLMTPEQFEDPTNVGWNFCKAHKSEWVKGNAETDRYLTVGFVKGCDFAIFNDKVYFLHKVFQDLNNKYTVILCRESTMSCDV